MKKFLIYTTLVLISFSSCSKEDSFSSKEQALQDQNAASANSAKVEHIKESDTSPVEFSILNPCTGEVVDISGTLHYKLHWIISGNKETYVLHFNASNMKGVGRTSGTKYVTTSTFNYSNTNSFSGEHRVFQQSASTRFTALGGDGSFTLVNDWHLTVNANGEEVHFSSTGGEVSTCK